MRMVFGLGIMFAACVAIAQEPMPKEKAKELTAEQKELLKEAQKWGEETTRLIEQGKLEAAIATTEKKLGIEIKIHGELHDSPIKSLEQISELQEELETLEAARTTRKRIVDLQKKRFGNDHWQSIDAMVNFRAVDELIALDEVKRKEVLATREMEGRVHDLFRTADYAKAVKIATEIVRIHKANLGERHPYYATSLNNLAAINESQGNYGEAERLYLEAIRINEKILGRNHPRYAIAIDNLGKLYQSLGKYREAEKLHLEARGIQFQQLGRNHRSYELVTENLGVLYKYLGEYRKSESHLLEVMTLRRDRIGTDQAEYAQILNNLGQLYREVSDYGKAENDYLGAREAIAKSLGEAHPYYANTLSNLGILYDLMGDYRKAEAVHLQAAEIRKRRLGENHPQYAISLNNLAIVYEALAEYDKAERNHLQAAEIRKRKFGENHHEYAQSLNNLAGLYSKMRRTPEAETLYRQSLLIREKQLGEMHRDTAASVNNLALLLRSKGELAESGQLSERSVEQHRKLVGEHHPDFAKSLSNLAMYYLAVKKPAEAEKLSRRAVEVMAEHLEKTAESQTEEGQFTYAAFTRPYLDNLLSDTRDLESSANYDLMFRLRGAITVRQSFLRSLRTAKVELKPRILELQKVTRELSRLANTVPDPKMKFELPAKIQELTDQYDKLQKELAASSESFNEYRKQRNLSCADVQKSFLKDAVLIDLIQYDSWLCAFLVTPEKIHRVELGEIKPISEAIQKFRENLDRTSPGTEVADPGLFLRKAIWEKLEPHLKGVKTVFLTPDGDLSRLPFGALPGSDPKKFLIEEVSIVVVPAPQMLPDLLKAKPSSEALSMLVVGDVDFGGEVKAKSDSLGNRSAVRGNKPLSWGNLEGSKLEVEKIYEAFGKHHDAKNGILLTQLEATKERFRQEAPKHRYLHLATHGYFADPKIRSAAQNDPRREKEMFGAMFTSEEQRRVVGHHPALLSGVVLAGANQLPKEGHDDGILTAFEVSELDLSKTELVVLSACETGLGKTAGGEGVLGLQRSFQIAGAKNVICSLWKVSDEATAAMMTLFYRKLWIEKKSPQEALRESQLFIMNNPKAIPKLAKMRGVNFTEKDLPELTELKDTGNERASIKLWASFVLSGSGR